MRNYYQIINKGKQLLLIKIYLKIKRKCRGTEKIYVDPEYWRKNNLSDIIEYCLN